MTKRILSILLLLAYPLSARFYIGIEGGYARNLGVFDIRQNNLNPLNLKKEILREDGMIGNVVLGTEHFFLKNYLGIRWGVFAGYGQTWGENKAYGKISTSTSMMGANVDVLVNFIAREKMTAGVFVGIGYGYIIPNPKKKIQYGEHFALKVPIIIPPKTIWVDMNNDCFVDNQFSYGAPLLRFGTSILIAKHHRIELLAKIPLKVFKKSDSFLLEWNNASLSFHRKYDTKVFYAHTFAQAFVSYKYVF